MQQITSNIDLFNSFYCLFFSFVLTELKPFCLEGESPGGKILKKCEKSVKNYGTILPFSFSLILLPDPEERDCHN